MAPCPVLGTKRWPPAPYLFSVIAEYFSVLIAGAENTDDDAEQSSFSHSGW